SKDIVLLGDVINDLAIKYPMITVAQVLDKMKDAGFYWATRSCVTITMHDVRVLANKTEMLESYEKEAERIERKDWDQGALTKRERDERLVERRDEATDSVGNAVEALEQDDDPTAMIIESGSTDIK